MTTAPNGPNAHGTTATAADETRHVAGVAGEEARSVAHDARDQLRQLIDQSMQQLDEHGSVQRDRLVELLRTLSGDLHQMAETSQSSGAPTPSYGREQTAPMSSRKGWTDER